MILAYILSLTLDIHSSCLSIKSGNKEVFSPFKTCSSLVIVNSISIPLIYKWENKFKSKHPKLVRSILICGIILHSSAAIYNYKLIHSKK